MEILKLINKRFNNKYSYLRVLRVEYNTLLSYAEVTFLYPQEMNDLETEEKQEITDFIKETIKVSCDIKIKFKKSYLDDNLIKKHLLEYLKSTYSSMFAFYQDENINIERQDSQIIVKISLISSMYNYFIFNDIKDNVLNSLNKNFIGNFAVELIKNDKVEVDEQILIAHEEEFVNSLPKPKPVERYEVYEPAKLFGVDITPMPEYIKNQNDEKIAVILAGKVSNLVEKTYISKRTKQKGGTEPSYYYSFTLTDHTSNISAIYFSNKTTYKKIINLKDGDSILVVGDIRNNQRGKTLHIKAISYCEIVEPTQIIEKEELQEEQLLCGVHIDEYKVVKPVPYVSLTQSNLFDKVPIYNDFIKQNQFVVFDVETTGFDKDYNEIIEIGAVKVVEGKIVEQFQTFICPENEIPKHITDLTTITNDMVKDAPFIKDAITDFYKFCENCTLVGYNVEFDIGFIKSAGAKANLLFDNKSSDAMELAKSKLYLPRYKLINVVEALNITLNNAHRAIADAIATAYVFLKLNEI